MSDSFSESLRRALHRRDEWSHDRAKRVMQSLLAAVASAWLDWDEGAGESWARLLIGDKFAALVSLEMPLVIIRNSLMGYANGLSELDGIEVVPVSGFDDRSYSIDRELAQALQLPRLEAEFDTRHFSITEFWWATI